MAIAVPCLVIARAGGVLPAATGSRLSVPQPQCSAGVVGLLAGSSRWAVAATALAFAAQWDLRRNRDAAATAVRSRRRTAVTAVSASPAADAVVSVRRSPAATTSIRRSPSGAAAPSARRSPRRPFAAPVRRNPRGAPLPGARQGPRDAAATAARPDAAGPRKEQPEAEALAAPLQFASGDSLTVARRLAGGAAPPWSKDVEAKAIIAVSQGSGNVVRMLARSAFRQFGVSSRMRVFVYSRVRTTEGVEELVAKAKKRSEALIVYTMASPELSAAMASKCLAAKVPCFNVLETTLSTMEKHFDMQRSSNIVGPDEGLLPPHRKRSTIFAASDGTGTTVAAAVKASLRQFRGCGVETVTVCPRVHTLEEVDLIALEAFASDSVVLFSFASPGMSRFMRQQCTRLKVSHIDIFLPLVFSMEAYLKYPPVGVAGGLDLTNIDPKSLQWERQAVQ